MKLTFLGTGTSVGVPQIGCHCPTCSSTDPRDNRLRASAIVHLDNGKNILIDCGPDFRTQILRQGSPELAAMLITHSHYDHTGGIDDLRPYCKGHIHFPTYCKADVAEDLRQRNPWSFAKVLYPGVPTFAIHEIDAEKPFIVEDTEIIPLPVMHGKLPILGFRIGDLAYITDCKTMPDETLEKLRGVKTLVLNALRPQPHPTHLSTSEAIELVAKIAPEQAYFTHMSHDTAPTSEVILPDNIHLAHDTLVIS